MYTERDQLPSMIHMTGVFLLLVLTFTPFAAANGMDEGMWLLDSLARLPFGGTSARHLQLTPGQIYSTSGPSLKDAIVSLDGGTASFVSAQGLMLTSWSTSSPGIRVHHPLRPDLAADGFLAVTRDEELPLVSTARVVVGMKDVTNEIRSAVNDTMSAETCALVLLQKSRQMERSALAATGHIAHVAEMYDGLAYYLLTYIELRDIRLVYAPPGAVVTPDDDGEGRTWPRHAADFAFMRAYVSPDGKPEKYSRENVPFTPAAFLPFSIQGYDTGTFAMALGFPTRTHRNREAAALQLARDETLPVTISLYKERINIIQNAAKDDRHVRIRYAARLRGLVHTCRDYLAMLEGMRRMDLLTWKRDAEGRFSEYVASDPTLTRRYGSLLADLAKASAALRTLTRKSVVEHHLSTGVEILRIADRLRDLTAPMGVNPAGKVKSLSEQQRAEFHWFAGRILGNVNLDVDKKILAALIVASLDPEPEAGAEHQHQAVQLFQEIAGNGPAAEREARVRAYVDELYEHTALCSLDGCDRLLGLDSSAVNEDPFIGFSAALSDEMRPVILASRRINVEMRPLRQNLLEGWLEWKKGERVYPDANRTLRLTFGKVTSAGMHEPFRLHNNGTVTQEAPGEDLTGTPARILELWENRDFGRYADPQTGKMPVAFAATLDVIDGNAGSPVLNGQGKIIGCAYEGDRSWSVSNYCYQKQLNRTLSIDARYMLFLLDKVSNAVNIMKEITVQ